jgi:AcrR family transcriptional regulator
MGGAMNTKEAIVEGFKELVVETSLDKIRVIDICAHVHISRKSFYNYFRDRNDIIEYIIQMEILNPLRELYLLFPTDQYKTAPKLITEKFYQSIYDRRYFFEKLVAHREQYMFQKLFIAELSELNWSALAYSDLSQTDREYMGYFYAAAQTMLVIKWIQDGWKVTPKQMMKFYFDWTLRLWWQAAHRNVEWPEFKNNEAMPYDSDMASN